MSYPPLACIILAAGRGTRMKSELPKVMHPIAGLPMLGHVLHAAAALTPERVIVVVGPEMSAVAQFVAPHITVTQNLQRGTADAVKAAANALKDFSGMVLVLYGDTPLVTSAALQQLLLVQQERSADVVVAGFTPLDPAAYGRIVQNEAGQVTAIIEAHEATPAQREITLCNGGMMLFSKPQAWDLLTKITNQNSKQEYYLTDLAGVAHQAGLVTACAAIPAEAVLGVNDRVELAQAESLMQQRLRDKAMRGGVSLRDPASVYFSHDTVLGRDVVVEPHVVFDTGVVVADRVTIRAFSHLAGVEIGNGAIIGPYARLRPNSVIEKGAHIGNFVELKNAVVGAGSKINHLSYIGDAEIGSGSNIGAGTITCNYDGYRKHRTIIGDNAFIGSNSALVAPIEVGDGAFVGAGSVITNNVPAGTLAVARGRQVNLENWARRMRDSKKDKD